MDKDAQEMQKVLSTLPIDRIIALTKQLYASERAKVKAGQADKDTIRAVNAARKVLKDF